MGGSVHQSTKVGYNSHTRITNTYPRKRGRLENLPLNSSIEFKKGFDRTDLKTRIARLKSSPAYKSGQIKAKSKIRSVYKKPNQTITVRSGNLKVNIS